MKDLHEAIETRRKYNLMPFEEFAEKVKKYIWDDLHEFEKHRFIQEKQRFEFTGLNNTDFFTMWNNKKL